MGVMIAATTKMISTAQRKFRIRKPRRDQPMAESTKITIGSSNISPRPRIMVSRKPK